MTERQELAVAVAALAVSQDLEAIAYHLERTREQLRRVARALRPDDRIGPDIELEALESRAQDGPPPIDQRD